MGQKRGLSPFLSHAEGAKLAIYNVGRELAGMYGLGIPADLEAFLKLGVSRKAVSDLSMR